MRKNFVLALAAVFLLFGLTAGLSAQETEDVSGTDVPEADGAGEMEAGAEESADDGEAGAAGEADGADAAAEEGGDAIADEAEEGEESEDAAEEAEAPEEAEADEDGEAEGVTHANGLTTTLAWYGGAAFEFKEDYKHSIKVPFGGTGMLTEGNNLTVDLKAGVSPVAVTPGIDLTVTPVAVLQFMVGGEVGSGWYFSPLGVNGVGVLDDAADANEYSKEPFSGFKLKGKVGGAFQFDTGAVVPGDWTNVVIRTYHEAYYQQLTSAEAGDFWEYETGKDNWNGWKYYANYLLGYRTPAVPVLDLAGCLFESETALTRRGESPSADGGWGSDFWDLKIAGLVNMQFNDSHGLASLVQFNRSPNYEQENPDEVDRPDRTIDPSNPAVWGFYRVAFQYTWSF